VLGDNWCDDMSHILHNTTTMLLKTLLITTSFLTLINVTLHFYFLFAVISKDIYKQNQLLMMSLQVIWHILSIVIVSKVIISKVIKSIFVVSFSRDVYKWCYQCFLYLIGPQGLCCSSLDVTSHVFT
jgi:hypothetical protein